MTSGARLQRAVVTEGVRVSGGCLAQNETIRPTRPIPVSYTHLEALSDRAVAALPKAVPGGICPYCGMKIAVSLYGTAFTNDHERFGFSNATVWQCNKSDLDYTLFRE